ncbi:serine hydrolase domain-containing protein [Kitasatospora sp. NPDC057738]|uniref:serine hydrolase domain-containing protein n=1 Tax=Kitasatospora sp. NPDC057738 TaxID=3346233 RepID=UPI0036CF423C
MADRHFRRLQGVSPSTGTGPAATESPSALPPSAPSSWRSLTVLLVAAAALGVGSLPASAVPATGPKDVVRAGLERLVADDRYPAAMASTTIAGGRVRNYTAGVADLRTGAKVPVDGQVRAGSNTKTYAAVVVLQLVGEGKVELDAPIDRYLPGLVRGEGIDGRAITVRQLLQHTSGLPNYTDDLFEAVFGEGRHHYYQPRDLLDLALAHKALFAPGTKWSYSNTNYVLAGLLIEKVTGRPFSEQITKRVIDRIGLRHTYFPGVGEEGIREAHPHGYHAPTTGGPLTDVTELDGSWGWAAGQLVSTPSDLNRFFSALMGGRLLGPAQLAEMKTTVRMPDEAASSPGEEYGLGLSRRPLSCGGVAWGHGGAMPGFHTLPGVTEDGRAATIAVTANIAPGPKSVEHFQAMLDTSLCAE